MFWLKCCVKCFLFIVISEILEGGVQIVQNKNLSLSIKWQDIVRDGDARIEIQNNGDKGLCH